MEYRGHQEFAPRAALQACSVCRKRKGKCDKIIPGCSFCVSKGLPCFYTAPGGSTQGLLMPQVNFPAVFFLDHEIFEKSSLAFPPAKAQVPLYIMQELGNSSQMTLVAAEFFSTIHQWMPVISKRLFYDHHLNPLNPFRADVALLCLGMKLMTWLPPPENQDPVTQTYILARQFLGSMDMSSTLTLATLQGSILIALYEISHAIYPAAYLSIGACAEHATALGLSWKTASWNGNSLPWVEIEERRRVWWAIVILERYLALGWPQRHIISEAPSDNDLLPVDDFLWDEGIVAQNYPMTTSAPGDINMGRFARLAQAVHLLDRVLKHNKDSTMTVAFRDEEATILDKALHALVSFTLEEAARRRILVCCQTFICHSALYLLHISYLHDSSGPRHDLAKRSVDRSAFHIIVSAENFLARSSAMPLGLLSPLSLHYNYQVQAYFVRLKRQNPTSDAVVALDKVQKSMRILGSRWRLAAVYLEIVEARQTMSQI